MFVQVYVAVIDEEGKARKNANACGGERDSRTDRRQRGEKNASPLLADPGLIGRERDPGRSERRTYGSRSDLQPFLTATDTAAAVDATPVDILGGHKPGNKSEVAPTASVYSGRLLWLFPNGGEECGRRAFDRHTICGGVDHALITLESAAAIVRDAGKVLPAELAWRWGRGRSGRDGTLQGGHLLGFQTFVEMCEGLKDHMTDISIISYEECCPPATSTVPAATDSSSSIDGT